MGRALGIGLFVTALCGLGGRADAGGISIEGNASSDFGWDSNVYRNFDGQAGEPVVADGLLQVGSDFELRTTGSSGQRTEVEGQFGARLFDVQSPEDMLVGQLAASHDVSLSRALTLRLDAEGKDKWVANDDRAYADWGGGLGLDWRPARRLDAALRAGWRTFDYFPDSDFTEAGPALSAELSGSPARKQLLFASYRLFPQLYRGPELTAAGVDAAPDARRFDWYHVASVGYSLRGPVVLSLTYRFVDDRSDAFGESFVRNRVEGLFGWILPGDIYLAATGALQITSYPDGLYLSPQLLLLEDDDDLNEVSVKLSRDLGGGFSLEARAGYYWNDFLQNGLTYERALVFGGIAYRR